MTRAPSRRGRGVASAPDRLRLRLAEAERQLEAVTAHRELLRDENQRLRQVERELLEARDRLATIYDLAPLGFLTLSAGGLVEEANGPALDLLGIPRERLQRYAFASAVRPEDRRTLRHALATIGGTGRVVVELGLQTRADRIVPVVVHARAGEGLRTYVAIVDLSERERSDQQRRELEVRAEAARLASEAKDDFLATLSHELRTPLTPAMLAAKALEDELGDHATARAQQLLASVQRGMLFEVRLVDDLLDISRITHRKLSLERNEVELGGVARDTIQLLDAELRDKRLRLHLALEPNLWALADAARLRQVFWNLLRNAVKFSQPGGRVRVAGKHHGGNVRMTVHDSGRGLSGGEAERIFDRFEQGADAVKHGGLGLGLAIARGIVDAHGGSIRAASAGAGRGTTFVFDVPAIEGPRKPAQPSSRNIAKAAVDGHGLHILYVEDHADTATVLTGLLARAGHHVTHADSVAAALRHARDPIDLLISDVGLPDGSGYDVVRGLARKRHAPTKAIALSGYGNDEAIERSAAQGFCRHLVKPIKLDDLLAVIAEEARSLPVKFGSGSRG